MTKKLTEYKKMTGEKLRQKALADPSRVDFDEMTEDERRELFARMDEIEKNITQTLIDLNNGK